MKGLMVSLIIVFFAGAASSVSAAGQQAGEDAAGFKPRLGLQPLLVPERPGPDDSEDEVDWPEPTSLLSRNSTTTSNSFSDKQFGAPAPESSADKNIRFDVKVDDDAITKLRQGLKVYSPVDVRDRSNAALHPEVVSDIALFHNANSGKKLNGVRLEPAPMEPGSSTLTFEIHEDQLNRIEQDAFLFSVPEQLRGRFDRVEFVAVSTPSGSHEFSSGVSGGTRGSALGLSDANNRFGTTPSNRFGSTSDPSEFARQWGDGSPTPGPRPGDDQFVGPVIERSELEARRNRLAPLDSNQGFGQRNGFSQQQNDRSVLNTSDRFRTAERESEVQPRQSPFGRTWEQPENSQDATDRRNALDQRNAFNQRTEPTLAEQRLAALEKQLAVERAEKDRIARNASDWMEEAKRIAQQRNDYSLQLREVNSRPALEQPARQVNYQERPATSPAYWDQAVAAAKGIVRPFGSEQGDFKTQEAGYARSGGVTLSELDRRAELAKAEKLARQYADKTGELEAELESIRLARLPERNGPASSGIQPAGYKETEFNSSEQGNRGRQGQVDSQVQAQRNVAESVPLNRSSVIRSIEPTKGGAPAKSGSSDLIWLLPLLLGSLGLNFFLWVHCRTLDLRYNDLADELRDMVGGSTIV